MKLFKNSSKTILFCLFSFVFVLSIFNINTADAITATCSVSPNPAINYPLGSVVNLSVSASSDATWCEVKVDGTTYWANNDTSGPIHLTRGAIGTSVGSHQGTVSCHNAAVKWSSLSTCNYTVIDPPGVCGSSDGGTFSSAPTTNLCSTGTASSVTGSGPWNWSCDNTTCTAKFEKTTYNLFVNKDYESKGTGTTSGGGDYIKGSTATATANPSGDSWFSEWIGDCDQNTGEVLMNGDKSCSAVFGKKVPAPSGSISATDCTIAINASTCSSSVSWSSSNIVSGSSFAVTHNNPSNTSVSSSKSGSQSISITNGFTDFYIYNNNVELNSATATASCASGSSWDTTSKTCKASTVTPITVSISASPAGPLTATGATALTWTTTNSPDSCEASNSWSGSKISSGWSEARTGMAVGTYNFDITCKKAGLSDAIDSVAVVVIGTWSTLTCSSTPGTAATTLTSTCSPVGTCTGATPTKDCPAVSATDSCGSANGTPQLSSDPSGTAACSVGTYSNSPADTTTSGSQTWKWSCGTVTTCSAPKFGCRTTTDSNYDLSSYGANGPNNNYGCAATCENGDTNYPTCTIPPVVKCTIITDTNYNIAPCSNTCKNGDTNYPTCTIPPVTDTCGPSSGSTPQDPQPTGTNACSKGTYFSTPADTSSVWNWSCGTVTSCSAPKMGCTVTTDTNYNATGPNNDWACKLICKNGDINYPTCTTGGDTPINGGWSDWSGQVCGTGTGNQTRYCNNPAPSNGGLECLKSDGSRGLRESISYQQEACPPPPECTNGANNPPTCTIFPSCTNGANNPPTCTTCPSSQSLISGKCVNKIIYQEN